MTAAASGNELDDGVAMRVRSVERVVKDSANGVEQSRAASNTTGTLEGKAIG